MSNKIGSFLILIIVGASIWATVSYHSFWPFSYYPMFSRSADFKNTESKEWIVLEGRTEAGAEIKSKDIFKGLPVYFRYKYLYQDFQRGIEGSDMNLRDATKFLLERYNLQAGDKLIRINLYKQIKQQQELVLEVSSD